MPSRETGNGIVTIESPHSVTETVRLLQAALADKAIKQFALIDHSGEAAQTGLQMPDTKLLIFGNPKAGTPLMLASPDIALDLPLKILVREGANGRTWVSYNSPGWLGARYGLNADSSSPLSAVEILARTALQA